MRVAYHVSFLGEKHSPCHLRNPRPSIFRVFFNIVGFNEIVEGYINNFGPARAMHYSGVQGGPQPIEGPCHTIRSY